jgi:hydrogenase nickel incorporation protein HypA/HybF
MIQALELAETLARERGGREIHRLVLRVGASSGVDADALRWAFEAAAAGTLAAQAELEIHEVATVCRCRSCERAFRPDSAVFACPGCGTIATELAAGDDLELTTLEFT